jgi:hypothetical protein
MPLLLAFEARRGGGEVGSSGGLGVVVGDNRLMPFRVEFKLTSPYVAVTSGSAGNWTWRILTHLSVALTSVGLDLGQTRPSMGHVSMGQKVNGLTDPSVERCRHLGFCHHDKPQC